MKMAEDDIARLLQNAEFEEILDFWNIQFIFCWQKWLKRRKRINYVLPPPPNTDKMYIVLVQI